MATFVYLNEEARLARYIIIRWRIWTGYAVRTFNFNEAHYKLSGNMNVNHQREVFRLPLRPGEAQCPVMPVEQCA